VRAAKVDQNQPLIVATLREVGATVQHLHAVGKGCPDLLVGYRGQNHLIEVKDGSKPKSARLLTPDQVEWHSGWRGCVRIAESVDDALRIIGAAHGEIKR
jgi:hypothetical protein